MALITIALMAVFRLQAQNLDLQSEAQFMTIARYLAQDRLAMIESGTALDPGERTGDFGDAFPDFAYRETITEAEREDTEGLFRVRLQIFKEEAAGVKTFTTETYLFISPL
jgi:hypothetical protein